MNTVPQNNDIILSRWISQSFFWLMLINIAVSKVLYDAVKYGEKAVIAILRITTIIWGVGLVTVCVFYFIDWSYSNIKAAEVWKKLSMNQKRFFDISVEELSAQRTLNAELVASFTLISGVFFMVEGGLMCWLYPLLDVVDNLSKDNKELDKGELPTMEKGTAYRFPGLVDQNEDLHHKYI